MQQVSVDKIAAKSIEEREQEINQTADIADVYLRSGKDTLVMTSRQLVVGKSESSSKVIMYLFPPKHCISISIFYSFI